MKARVKVRFMGALSYQLGKEHTIDLEECPSIAELLESIASSRGYYLDQESIAVYHRGEPVKLDDEACRYDELSVIRIARGGSSAWLAGL